ncbi:unnamed protein product [Sphenostylis stenocarpa]|uniref:Adipocyte plasma membrane-associated protein n=1 Tax=Sphenostylis stenocarpa TaxID=92480 RepID=A0AA86SF34_9FABA|nr:unnamed protein product [Sphenostylis stenocarpa]
MAMLRWECLNERKQMIDFMLTVKYLIVACICWQHLQHFLSKHRSELCNPKASASPLSYVETEHICGRPLGLRFDKKTGDLYIADAYFGVMMVGPQGGLATSLATEAEGVPLRFTNDVDIDTEGNLYFTDSSSNFQRK